MNLKFYVYMAFLLLVIPLVDASGFFLHEGELKPIVCGDNICSLGENPENCPIDCLGVTFIATLETPQIFVSAGTTFTQRLLIRSFSENFETFFFESSNDSFVNIPISQLSINRTGTVDVIFEAPLFSDSYVLQGSIDVTSINGSQNVPFSINIVQTGAQITRPTIDILSSRIVRNRPIEFVTRVVFPNSGTPRIVTLFLKTNNSEHLLQSFQTEDARFDYRGKVTLNEYDRSEVYTLLVRVVEGEISVEAKQELQPTTSIFQTWYFLLFIIVFGVLPGSYGILKLVLFIRKKILNRRRYILPKFKYLPGKSDRVFEVGKIADTSTKAFFNTSDLVTHMLVAGSTGSGKSVTASVVTEEALRQKIPVIIFDPTAQWTGLLSPLRDKGILKEYSKFGLSPDDAMSFRGVIFTPKNESFDLDIDMYLNPGEVTIFNLASLTTVQYDAAVAKIIDKLFARHWEESPDLQVLVVFDEVHRLLDKSLRGAGYSALTKACREFRKWGIGLIMASQVSSDFKETIGGNVLTEVQLNTKNLEDIKKIEKKYGLDFSQRIARQGIGVALVQNGRYNEGKPWFIHFRPPLHNPRKLSEGDLHLYDMYTQRLHKIKLKINALSDASLKEDYEMDYTMAYNKLKEGKFKMAEIYIQSLEEKIH